MGRNGTMQTATTDVKVKELTPDQLRLLAEQGVDGAAEVEDVEDDEPEVPSQSAGEGIPDWCAVPEGWAPPKGRQVWFLLLRASWTDVPNKGDRTLVLWTLTEADEKLALKRTRGESLRTIDELTKQIIRVVDGKRVDWAQGKACAAEVVWNEIGTKLRQELKNFYVKTHTLTMEERTDFLSNCVAVRTFVG
jgi:hypothetical protein